MSYESKVPTATKPRSLNLFGSILHNPLGLVSVAWLMLLLLSAILATVLAPADPQVTDLSAIAVSPSGDHPLGTDSVGRDVLSRLLHGGQITLLSAALASLTAIVIGVPAGLLAGYHGKLLDGTTSWFANLLMSLPSIVVLLALRAAFGPSVWVSMIAFGVMLSPTFFRLARAATQAIRKELYVDAARVSGLSDGRIIIRHIFTVVRAPIIIQAAMVGGMAISIQSGLDFLGLGDPSMATWGIMLSEAFAKIYQFPQLLLAPGIAISATIAAFGVLANAIRDVLEDSPTITKDSRNRRPGKGSHQVLIPSESDQALVVTDLKVGYALSDGGHNEVVHGVSLYVRHGEVLGLVGESGSGKTQIALSVLGLLPLGGSVLGGRVHTKIRNSTHSTNLLGLIGYVPQEPMTNLDPSFTVGHQLVRPLVTRHGMRRKNAEAKIRQLLLTVGIDDPDRTMRAYPHEISGGMAQRVLIAGAVAPEPEILIADEPTTALDVTVQAEVLEVLRKLQEQNQMAMLLVTHNFGIVADLCDRVAVMRSGRIVEVGDVHEVFRNPQHPYTQELLAATLVGRERETHRLPADETEIKGQK